MILNEIEEMLKKHCRTVAEWLGVGQTLECPACGADSNKISIYNVGGATWHYGQKPTGQHTIRCNRCAHRIDGCKTEKTAIAIWNRQRELEPGMLDKGREFMANKSERTGER